MELFVIVFVMIGLLKFLSTSKMVIMLMSLEVGSVFLYTLMIIFSSFGGSMSVGFYLTFLILVVSEGVMILLSMMMIYQGGGVMAKDLSNLKF